MRPLSGLPRCIACALVLTACAIAPGALADETAQPSTELDHPWSIGFSLGTTYYGGLGLSSSGIGFDVTPPSVNPWVSVERKLTPRVSLLLGGVLYSRTLSYPTLPPPTYGGTMTSLTGVSWFGLGVVAGLRSSITDPSAPVEVSLYAALGLSAAAASADADAVSYDGSRSTTTADARRLGASVLGGLSASRALAERLELRIDLQLLQAGLARTRTRRDVTGPFLVTSELEASFSPAAALGLRLSF